MHKGQAENLVPILEALLEEANKTWSELSAIGVGTGPGNFTGIRISGACARGMALPLGIACVGVTALEAQTYGLPHPIYSLIPARREMFYVQKFDGKAGAVEQMSLLEAQHLTEGKNAVGPADQTDFPPSETPIAVAIAKIAADRLQTLSKDSRPSPFYVRSADAAPAKDAPPVLLD
jgi:tRNA threonylcarbamoyl adenosine modification protein YeaZ